MNLEHEGERGSRSALLFRRVGAAAIATVEQLLCVSLLLVCVHVGAWAQLVTVLLAMVFVAGLRAARG